MKFLSLLMGIILISIASKAQNTITFFSFTSTNNSISFGGNKMPLNFNTAITYDNKKLKILRSTPAGETSELWDVSQITYSPNLEKDSTGEIRLEINSPDNQIKDDFLLIKLTKSKKNKIIFDCEGKLAEKADEPGNYNFTIDNKSFQLKFSQNPNILITL